MPRLISPTGVEIPSRANPRPLPPRSVDPTYQQQPIAPIHLSASVLLQTGSTQGVSAQALQNPMGQDMEILEVKFEVIGQTDLAVNETGAPFGGSVACNLKLGEHKITNGSVPVWSFGRAENLSGETKVSAGDALSYNTYSWRLPRPLFVPAGAVLAPTFNHLGFVTGPLNVRVGYSARSVSKAPKTVCLPWVTAYISKAFNPISRMASDRSQPQQLMNDTADVFYLQRFTGRLMFLRVNGFASENDIPSFGSRFLTARVVDSYGRPIVRTYAPFRSVFGDVTRSWELEEVGAQLDPGAYYRVFLKKAAMEMASDAIAASQAQAFVGMVGWREVAV